MLICVVSVSTDLRNNVVCAALCSLPLCAGRAALAVLRRTPQPQGPQRHMRMRLQWPTPAAAAASPAHPAAPAAPCSTLQTRPSPQVGRWAAGSRRPSWDHHPRTHPPASGCRACLVRRGRLWGAAAEALPPPPGHPGSASASPNGPDPHTPRRRPPPHPFWHAHRAPAVPPLAPCAVLLGDEHLPSSVYSGPHGAIQCRKAVRYMWPPACLRACHTKDSCHEKDSCRCVLYRVMLC